MSLTGGGQVAFGQIQRVQQYANYMAPETDEGFVMTATSIEQVHCIGPHGHWVWGMVGWGLVWRSTFNVLVLIIV